MAVDELLHHAVRGVPKVFFGHFFSFDDTRALVGRRMRRVRRAALLKRALGRGIAGLEVRIARGYGATSSNGVVGTL